MKTNTLKKTTLLAAVAVMGMAAMPVADASAAIQAIASTNIKQFCKNLGDGIAGDFGAAGTNHSGGGGGTITLVNGVWTFTPTPGPHPCPFK